MNYIPYAAWWIRPSGTSAQIANYFCSWGLGETLVAPTVASVVRMPSMPIIVTMPTYTANFCSLILLFLSWLT